MTTAKQPENARALPPPLESPAGGVLSVYHMGRADVGSFAPFSHFGTLNAAFERLIQKDVLVRGESPDTYLNGTTFYAVQLRIKNPLVVDDDFTWDSNGINNATAQHFNADERRYLDAVNDMSDQAIRAELAQGQLYDAGDSVADNRRHLAQQRMVAVLESKGYDGIAYINRDEDIGSVSWVNFRPQQVESIYSGAMTNKPCVALPARPKSWRENLASVFSGHAVAPVEGLPQLAGYRMKTPPETVAKIVDHFADVEARWCAEQDMREQQFQAEIAIALYDPEYVAGRVANGDIAIAAFYERCQQRMSELAATAPEELPSWQRTYLPEIKRAAGEINTRAATAVAARPKPQAQPSF